MNTDTPETPRPVCWSALLAEAAHSSMTTEKAMRLAEDFCKHESWGLDFWREPMAVLAAEVARLQAANARTVEAGSPTEDL